MLTVHSLALVHAVQPSSGRPGTVGRMGKALLVVIGIVLLVYAFFDLLATRRDRVRYLPKPLWFAVLLIPYVGALLWIVLGTRRVAPPPPGRGRQQPRGPRGPDDDPDYLRGL